MQKLSVVLTMSMLLALSAFSQKKEAPKSAPEAMMPPGPITNSYFTWMVGEWTGSSESNMGKTEDTQKIEWSLDSQFVLVDYSSKFVDVKPEALKGMATMMKMSEDEAKMAIMAKPYKGMGHFTVNPKNGDFMGYWFDSMRGSYKGTGKIKGNKLTAKWSGDMGTSTRTMEKMGEDSMVETFKESNPMGMVTEGKSTWTRKK